MKIIKKYPYLILLLIIPIFFFLFINHFNGLEKEEETLTIEEETEIIEEPEEVVVKTVKVDIKGAVKNPGVYVLEETSRVIDVIEKAGGLLENAHTSFINLSKIIKDEMVIIIYTKEEIESIAKEEIKYEIVEIPCECPDTINDACIEEKEELKEVVKEENNKVNINEASLEELLTIPGIGESKAKNIITYRESFKFTDIEQIKEVSGIGEALFEKIKDYITV